MNWAQVSSVEIPGGNFTRHFVFDSAKCLSNTFKTCENISQYFKRKHLNTMLLLTNCEVHT